MQRSSKSLDVCSNRSTGASKNSQIFELKFGYLRIFVYICIMKNILLIGIFLFSTLFSVQAERVVVGAEQTKQYLPLLKDKRVALLSNHTGIVIQGKDTVHTLDLLLKQMATR